MIHAAPSLFDYQAEALKKIKNGCILNGGVGSGKSRTGIAYYYILHGGKVVFYKEALPYQWTDGPYDFITGDKLDSTPEYTFMKNPKDLYIITTAGKRDKKEWDTDLINFNLHSTDKSLHCYKNKIVVDSWNNISKYTEIKNAFFIFDEQRLVGYGTWVKSFFKIAKNNQWILLSATPGDTWMDFMPIFVANGYFRNKTDFCDQHVIWSRHTTYPKIERFYNEGILIKYKKNLLIEMSFDRKTERHNIDYEVTYNKILYDMICKDRWNIYNNEPIKNASEYCNVLRRVVNSDSSRLEAIIDILKNHPKVILFYSYNYELDLLRQLCMSLNYKFAEWNGHKHEPLPSGDKWVYLVEYTAGCEGWNCTTTDTEIFYSQNYSYKVMEQASGRIDRLNTPYEDLYYYHLISKSKIDTAIRATIRRKKKFNQKGFAPEFASNT